MYYKFRLCLNVPANYETPHMALQAKKLHFEFEKMSDFVQEDFAGLHLWWWQLDIC